MTNELAKAIELVKERLPYMTLEQAQELLALVRAALATIAKLQGGGPLPESAVAAMAECVDDKQMAGIVRDLAHGIPDPGMFKPGPSKPVVRGGWSEPRNEDRSRDFARYDRLVEGLVGGANDTSRLK